MEGLTGVGDGGGAEDGMYRKRENSQCRNEGCTGVGEGVTAGNGRTEEIAKRRGGYDGGMLRKKGRER